MNNLELNKIYCESNLETMARMPDNFVDLTVTSPPYDNLRTYKDDIDETWGENIWKHIIKELFRVTKKGGVVVWVVGDATINGSETGTSFKQALHAIDCGFLLHDTMIYEKDSCSFPDKTRYYQIFEYMFVFSKGKPIVFNPIKDRKNIWAGTKTHGTKRESNGALTKRQKIYYMDEFGVRNNVWKYNTGLNNSTSDKEAFKHPAIFPEKLVRDHIYSWSNEGDLVYDPFMGSGTTAKMAHELKRNWIGSEISKEYVDLVNKRLEPYLNQTSLF